MNTSCSPYFKLLLLLLLAFGQSSCTLVKPTKLPNPTLPPLSSAPATSPTTPQSITPNDAIAGNITGKWLYGEKALAAQYKVASNKKNKTKTKTKTYTKIQLPNGHWQTTVSHDRTHQGATKIVIETVTETMIQDDGSVLLIQEKNMRNHVLVKYDPPMVILAAQVKTTLPTTWQQSKMIVTDLHTGALRDQGSCQYRSWLGKIIPTQKGNAYVVYTERNFNLKLAKGTIKTQDAYMLHHAPLYFEHQQNLITLGFIRTQLKKRFDKIPFTLGEPPFKLINAGK